MNPLIAVPLMISAELLITSLFCEALSTSVFASTCIPNILCFSHVLCKQCKQNCLISLNPEENARYHMVHKYGTLYHIYLLILSCFKSFSASLQPNAHNFFLVLSCCLHVFYSTIGQSFAGWSTDKALNILYICKNKQIFTFKSHHPY